MIKFNKPNELNGSQLCDELEAAGIAINRLTSPLLDGNKDFWLDIDPTNEKAAIEILKDHKPKPKPEPTIEEKLASVGLNLADLKAALGL